MKNKSHYLLYAFWVGLGILILTLLLGDFYPTIKSFFFTDANTQEAFNQALTKINWVRTLTRPFFISSIMAVFKYYSDKKTSNKSTQNVQ